MKKIFLILLTLASASGLFLSGCAAQATTPVLPGSSWRLVSYGPVQNQSTAAPGIQTSLEFGTDGTLNGNMGCNSFSGNYQVKSNQLIITQVISTMMACLGPQMDQERATLKMLNGTVRFQLQGSSLVLYSADGVSALTLSR